MATSRPPRVTFITRLALTCVVIVTLGATGENLRPDVVNTNVNSTVAHSCPSVDGACPVEKGYVLYNKRCLKLYTDKQDYQTAKTRCQTDGAHLFYFKSREEDGPALLNLMNTCQVLQPIGQRWWVGATRIKEEGRLQWSDRTPLTKDSGLWFSAQPDNWDNSENCIELGYVTAVVSSIMLNDLYCTKTQGFVCEVNIKT